MKNKEDIEVEKAYKRWKKTFDKLYDVIEEVGRDNEQYEAAMHEMCKSRKELEQKRKIKWLKKRK